jgi:hypothetical protein
MAFISHGDNSINFKEIFNEEHASLIIEEEVHRNPNFTTVALDNVGIKIMRDIF